jgi:hypothetical protein
MKPTGANAPAGTIGVTLKLKATVPPGQQIASSLGSSATLACAKGSVQHT